MNLSVFVLLLGAMSVAVVDSSQCAASPALAGHCGCCPIIGGSCVHFSTVDNIDVSWHVCVPESRRSNFSLKECRPHLIPDRNSTRLCRTKNGTFRFFPQCAMKAVCSLPLPTRNGNPTDERSIERSDARLCLGTRQCSAEKAVAGSCNQTLTRFTYDAEKRACVPFVYSGCGGTANRFLLQARCEMTCVKSKPK